MVKKRLYQLCKLSLVALFFIVLGCTGSSSVTDLNGTWENTSTKERVEIKFNGEKKIIIVENKEIPVTVKETEQDNYTLHITDTSVGEKSWQLRKIYGDTGSAFTLAFVRGGKKEMLKKVEG